MWRSGARRKSGRGAAVRGRTRLLRPKWRTPIAIRYDDGVDKSSIVSRIAHESCARAPSLLAEGHWWEELDRDFARQPEAFELAIADRLRVGAAASFDTVLRTAGASMISSMALPLGYNPIELRKAVRDSSSTRPSRSRPTLPVSSLLRRRACVCVRARDAGSASSPKTESARRSASTVRFPQPVNPRQHKPYLRHSANRVAHARLLRHRGSERRPTIVAIHGFTADWYLVDEWVFALPWFYRMGCNIALFTLPFHGPRQTRFSPFSGHGYFAGGTSRLNEVVAQSVFDFRNSLRLAGT